MRISIKLAHNKGIILPFDYQYAVQAWIYKVLSQSDAELASQLHDHGYPLFGKTFKLFCFSPWNAINYKIISGSGLQLLESFSELQVSFLIPEVMQSFVMGLFAGQSHRFFFKNAPSFDVVTNHIEIIQEPKWIDGPQDYLLRSGARISKQIDGKKYAQYQSPLDEGYTDQFIQNLRNKILATGVTLPNYIRPNIQFLSEPRSYKYNIPKEERMIEMKTYSFKFNLDAPQIWHRTLYYAGAGEECSLGLGWVEIIEENQKLLIKNF
ncbi:MAG: hypothetical protein KA767_07765 [Saprospiraceae bacterium]|mgnify:CR=1 FL=1|nr:hypothetical protein [Saprospiraceae bacterium]